MISLNLYLRNPWSTEFQNLWCGVYTTPFSHKSLELELTRDCTVVSVMLNWTVRQSHAGLDMELGLLGYCVRVNFYDRRHWDSKLDDWAQHD